MTIRRSDFLDAEDFARAVHEAGGWRSGQRRQSCGEGPYAGMLDAVWGVTDDSFLKELEREQNQHPHIFVKKWSGRTRKRKTNGE